jgi:mRNA interferase MazF
MKLVDGRAGADRIPIRGEVWVGDLDPVVGHEQAGRRPVLVVSDDSFNRTRAGWVVVLPITSTLRQVATRVRLNPPEGGLRRVSEVLCDSVRSVSKERLGARLGLVTASSMAAVEDRLRLLLHL